MPSFRNRERPKRSGLPISEAWQETNANMIPLEVCEHSQEIQPK